MDSDYREAIEEMFPGTWSRKLKTQGHTLPTQALFLEPELNEQPHASNPNTPQHTRRRLSVAGEEPSRGARRLSVAGE